MQFKEEWSEIEDKCEEVSRSIEVSLSDDNPLFHWLMEVQSIPNTTRRLRKNKPFFQIGARLMVSPITSLPGGTKFNDYWILPHKYSSLLVIDP